MRLAQGQSPRDPQGDAMKNVREKRVNLRFDESEYDHLVSLADGRRVATYCRDVLLAKKVRKKSAKNKYQGLPVELLRELNGIGNNLNQIARLAHQAKKANSLELWQLIQVMNLIQEDLEALLKLARRTKDAGENDS